MRTAKRPSPVSKWPWEGAALSARVHLVAVAIGVAGLVSGRASAPPRGTDWRIMRDRILPGTKTDRLLIARSA